MTKSVCCMISGCSFAVCVGLYVLVPNPIIAGFVGFNFGILLINIFV